MKNSCGILGEEWAGNNYVVPFDFAQIRDCIVAESLALPRGQPPHLLLHIGFLKAANTPNPSLPHSSYILRAIQEKMPLIECEMILGEWGTKAAR